MFILHLATEKVQQFYNKKGAAHLVIVEFRSINFMSLNSEFKRRNSRRGWKRTTFFLPLMKKVVL